MPIGRRVTDPKNAGRHGPRWRAFRVLVFRTKGTDCHWCGHELAFEVDHLIRLADGGAPYALDNAVPAHGSNHPCPVCVSPSTGRARCCNQERNRKPAIAPIARMRIDVEEL